MPSFFFVCREQKEKKEAKDRYWKVNALVLSFSRTPSHTLLFAFALAPCPYTFTSYMLRARLTKLRPTCPALQRSVQSARPRRREGKPKLKVSVSLVMSIRILNPCSRS